MSKRGLKCFEMLRAHNDYVISKYNEYVVSKDHEQGF